MNPTPVIARRPRRILHIVVAAIVALMVVPLVGAAPAGAAVQVPVSNVRMSWLWNVNSSLSSADGGSGSLSESRAAVAPAVLEPNPTGFVFTAGSGWYDPYTGETHIDFLGALTVGNTSFGNFGQKIDAPRIDIDAAGNGSLTGTFSVRGPGSADWNAPIARTVVATFAAPDNQVAVSGGNVAWTFTPNFTALSEGRRQWDPSFYNVIPPAMQSSYRESAGQGGNQPNKGPSPISTSFSFSAPALSASQTTGLLPAGQTITVSGAGYRPGINLFVVNCDAGFPAGARCDFGHVAQATTDAGGSFSVPATVVSRFGSGATATDCQSVGTQCAIQTSWIENPRDRSQEATLPLSFGVVAPTPDQLPKELAFTGSATAPLGGAGIALVAIGGLMVWAVRRRSAEVS